MSIFSLIKTRLNLYRQSQIDTQNFATSIRLGIEGLPDNITHMQAGGLYIISLPTNVSVPAVILETIVSSIALGHHLVLCGADGIAMKSALKDLSQSEQMKHQLSVFAYDQSLQDQPLQNIWSFFHALEKLDMHNADGMILLDASGLIGSASKRAMQRQLRILAEWHRYHKVTGVYVVQTTEIIWSYLHQHVSHLSGLARLHQEDHKTLWRVPFWRSRNNQTVHNQQFPVSYQQDGRIFSLNTFQGSEFNARPAHDDHVVLTCWNPALIGHSAPPNWNIFDSIEELIKYASSHATAATTILEYDTNTKLNDLIRQTHALRLACGRKLKIIVKEQCASKPLDYEGEMQLYNAGANRILRHEAELTVCFRMISALKGAIYWREIEADVEQLLGKSELSSGQGYLPLIDFIVTAEEFLQFSRSSNIESLIVRMSLRSERHHLAALQSFSAKRPGVFISTDNINLYLFMYACPASNVDAELNGLFNQPVSELFAFYETIVTLEETTELLKELRKNAEISGSTDFTDILWPNKATTTEANQEN